MEGSRGRYHKKKRDMRSNIYEAPKVSGTVLTLHMLPNLLLYSNPTEQKTMTHTFYVQGNEALEKLNNSPMVIELANKGTRNRKQSYLFLKSHLFPQYHAVIPEE